MDRPASIQVTMPWLQMKAVAPSVQHKVVRTLRVRSWPRNPRQTSPREHYHGRDRWLDRDTPRHLPSFRSPYAPRERLRQSTQKHPQGRLLRRARTSRWLPKAVGVQGSVGVGVALLAAEAARPGSVLV